MHFSKVSTPLAVIVDGLNSGQCCLIMGEEGFFALLSYCRGQVDSLLDGICHECRHCRVVSCCPAPDLQFLHSKTGSKACKCEDVLLGELAAARWDEVVEERK